MVPGNKIETVLISGVKLSGKLVEDNPDKNVISLEPELLSVGQKIRPEFHRIRRDQVAAITRIKTHHDPVG